MDFLKRVWEYVKNLLEKWKSLPTPSKILFGGVFLAIITALVLLLVFTMTPGYNLLVSGLSDEQSGYLIQQLETLGIAYKVEPGGRILISNRHNVYEVRMKLASQGILGTTTRGFEILDEQGFGATSFDKQVHYQIALQGELERSISTIRGVKMARVHLTLPKYTYYVRGEMAEPRASVLVALEPGQELSQNQIKGIMELVAGAVEGMKIENVKVVDNMSRVLSDKVMSEGDLLTASNRMELKMELESYYGNKIKRTLEAVFGPSRVEVIPDVRLNWKKIETEITKFEQPVRGGLVRSEEEESETSVNQPGAGGAVGTDSNIPPTTYPSSTPEGTTSYEKTHSIKNYELNTVVQHLVENREGEIESLTLSVIVDASSSVFQQFTEEERNKWASVVSDLVEKGIGASESATNLAVSVAFLPFDRSVEEMYQETMTQINQRKRLLMISTGVALLAVVGFITLYLILIQIRRSKARKLVAERKTRMEEELKKVLKEEVEEVELTPEQQALKELIDELEKVYRQSPEEIANIIKLWLVERGG